MKILEFRRFRKLSDMELLHRVHASYDSLQENKESYQGDLLTCNELIKEAKHRNLCCSKEIMYNKILTSYKEK